MGLNYVYDAIGNMIGSGKRTGKSGRYNGQAFGKDVSDSEIVAGVTNNRQAFVNNTRTMRRQWMVNAAFARSQQFSLLHRSDDRLVHVTPNPGRKHVTVDVIGPWKEHMIASFTRVIPKFTASPSSMDASDVSSARMGTALLEYYWDYWKFANNYIKIVSGLMDFGNMFVYLNYVEDGSKFNAREVIDGNTGMTVTDEVGDPVMEKTPIGDIERSIIYPQNVVMPLDDNELDDKPWVILIQNQNMDYFPMQYGDKGKLVKPETGASVNGNGYYGLDRIKQTDYVSNVQTANEIIYFQKPSMVNPDGMIAVVANGVMLQKEKWPYEKLIDRYPIEHFHVTKEAGEAFARSWIDRQVPLQRAYNLLWSILVENCDDMAHVKMLVPSTSDISEDDIHSINEILEYNAGQKPEYMDPGQMPAYFQNAFGMLLEQIRNVQNYHGASLGSAMSGVRSESHAQNLQGQDLLPLTVVDELMKVRFESLGEKILLIAADKLSEERVIQFTGKNKQIMYKNFVGSMLGNTKNVKVKMSGAWLRNKEATRAAVLQRVQMGGMTDRFGQIDTAKIDRLFEFDMPDTIDDELQGQTEQAYLENQKLLTDTSVVPVSYWQDHKTHMSVHEEFMNSSEVMELVDAAYNGDDSAKEVVQRFVEHDQQHQEFYMRELQALMPNEESTKGKQGGETNKETKPKQAAQPAKE